MTANTCGVGHGNAAVVALSEVAADGTLHLPPDSDCYAPESSCLFRNDAGAAVTFTRFKFTEFDLDPYDAVVIYDTVRTQSSFGFAVVAGEANERGGEGEGG